MSDRIKGKCLCGSVTIALDQTRPGVDVCHCSMCRQWSGGPFLSLRSVQPEAMDIGGREHVSIYASSDWAERAFCSKCGSNLWYHCKPGGHFSFLAGLFDLPEGYAMLEQIFIDEKPPYYTFADDTPTMTGAEVIAEAEAAGHTFD
ncbi:GFA family protein [Parerythrobacter aestuarii]|uniref:GFA family protein n=1 Tax=Parerythrobacter aestuarii TaxID=3020909 RepID=UPI0024DE625E|nr:GFA family protein [Parerythrobacter aestuarii]